MSDERDLIRRCVDGDEEAFALLVDRHKVMVWNIVDRVLHSADLVEDLAQEVFLRVYRGLPRFKGASKLSTWIYQIAYRLCLEELARADRRPAGPSLDDEEGNRSGRSVAWREDPAFERVHLRERIDRLLEELPEQHQIVIRLYYLMDRSYRDIAEITGLPIGTVKTYLFRAKQSLREKFSDLRGSDDELF